MGKAKALLEINSNFLVEELSHRLVDLGCNNIVVVINQDVEKRARQSYIFSKDFAGFGKVVVNKEIEKGQLYSIRLGLRELNDPGIGTFLLPVDHPFIRNQTLKILVRRAKKDKILIPVHRDAESGSRKRGHPPLFGSEMLNNLNIIPLHEGARGVYRRFPESVEEVDVEDSGIIRNVNTPEDWNKGMADYY